MEIITEQRAKHFTTLHTLQHYPYSIGKRESKS